MNQVPGSHLYLRLSGRLFRRKALLYLSVLEQKEGVEDVSGAEVHIRISDPFSSLLVSIGQHMNTYSLLESEKSFCFGHKLLKCQRKSVILTLKCFHGRDLPC